MNDWIIVPTILGPLRVRGSQITAIQDNGDRCAVYVNGSSDPFHVNLVGEDLLDAAIGAADRGVTWLVGP